MQRGDVAAAAEPGNRQTMKYSDGEMPCIILTIRGVTWRHQILGEA